MIKVRANKISIERPKEGAEIWIRVDVQRVESNGNIYNVTDHWDSFNKRMSEIYDEQYPDDNVSNSGMFTVANLGANITLVVASWIAQKYNGRIDLDTGDIIIEE